jgi:MFS family permease
MARDLAISTGAVFGAFSAALVVAALLGPFAGRRIDIAGGRDVLAASNLIFAAGLATLGAAQGAPMLFGGWLIIGVGMALGPKQPSRRWLGSMVARQAAGP